MSFDYNVVSKGILPKNISRKLSDNGDIVQKFYDDFVDDFL